jgi:hypothetical protein
MAGRDSPKKGAEGEISVKLRNSQAKGFRSDDVSGESEKTDAEG